MLNYAFRYPAYWQYFEAISAIPRASLCEASIADYLCRFAKDRGIFCVRDKDNNVMFRLPATVGYESVAPILLQGHSDMVCEKEAGVRHDFSQDGLSLYIEDGFLHARGTTLGADNGVSVAFMLFLADSELPHPTVECLITASEEIGLIGASAFDYRHVTARRMVNLDSAEEDSVIVGCAGGVRSDVTLGVTLLPCTGTALTVRIGGLMGGHSGEDIDKGRANANVLLGRILHAIAEQQPFRLCELFGGSKDNAIPREAYATLLVHDTTAARETAARVEKEIGGELTAEDRAFFVTLSEQSAPAMAMTEQDSRRVLSLLDGIENGVLAWSEAIRGLVAYSRNLGVLETQENAVILTVSSRSAEEAQLDMAQAYIEELAAAQGATVSHRGRYPGWDYIGKTPLLTAYIEAYERVNGATPRLVALHAGLECGIIRRALPDMDMISVGPDVFDLHSPRERLSIDSAERMIDVWLTLLSQT